MTSRPQAFARVFDAPYELLRESATRLPPPKTAIEADFVEGFRAYIEAALCVWQACFYGLEGKARAFDPNELSTISSEQGEKLFCIVITGLIRFTYIPAPEIGDQFIELLVRITPAHWNGIITPFSSSLRGQDNQRSENQIVDYVGDVLPTLKSEPLRRVMFVAYFSYFMALHRQGTVKAQARHEKSTRSYKSTSTDKAPSAHWDSAHFRWISPILTALVFVAYKQCQTSTNSPSHYDLPVPPAASEPEITSGAILGDFYENRFLGIRVPVPPNWTSMSNQEYELRRGQAKPLLSYSTRELQNRAEAAYQRTARLFTVRPKSDDGWAFIPTFTGMAEAIPAGMSASKYLDQVRMQFFQSAGSVLRGSAPSRLQCKGRALEGMDVEALVNNEPGLISFYVTTERGYGISFLLGAGEAATMAKLKALAEGIEFQR